jgi:nucleoside-diphosphate-sugar epimerase
MNMRPSPKSSSNENGCNGAECVPQRPSILVLGAAGFIGSWVTKSLSEAGADHIRLGVRRSSPRLETPTLDQVYCDILDPVTLKAAMKDVEVVINCVRDHTDGATVKGTKAMLAAARASGVKRIVQFSSIAVYGNARGVVTEDLPKAPVDRYGAEKVAAEKLCEDAAGPDLTIAIIRPALVYGPYGEEWTARFIRGILSGGLLRLGTAGQGQANLVYAGDLGEFVAELARKKLPHYSAFNVNGPEIPTFDTYFDRLSRALGQGPLPLASKHRTIQVSLKRQVRRAVRLLLRTQRPLLKKIARRSETMQSGLSVIESYFQYELCDEPRGRFAKVVVYSNDQAQRIGFRPKTSLSEGIAASVQWAKQSDAAGDRSDTFVPSSNRPTAAPLAEKRSQII